MGVHVSGRAYRLPGSADMLSTSSVPCAEARICGRVLRHLGLCLACPEMSGKGSASIADYTPPSWLFSSFMTRRNKCVRKDRGKNENGINCGAGGGPHHSAERHQQRVPGAGVQN